MIAALLLAAAPFVHYAEFTGSVDPGSGAFLVEACRALAARLVEAWNVHKEKKPIIPPIAAVPGPDRNTGAFGAAGRIHRRTAQDVRLWRAAQRRLWPDAGDCGKAEGQ